MAIAPLLNLLSNYLGLSVSASLQTSGCSETTAARGQPSLVMTQFPPFFSMRAVPPIASHAVKAILRQLSKSPCCVPPVWERANDYLPTRGRMNTARQRVKTLVSTRGNTVVNYSRVGYGERNRRGRKQNENVIVRIKPGVD